MLAAIDADEATLARTGRYGGAFRRYCRKRIAAVTAAEAEKRAEAQAAVLRVRRDQTAARMRALRARRRQERTGDDQ